MAKKPIFCVYSGIKNLYSFSHLFHIGLAVNGGSDWLNVITVTINKFSLPLKTK